jgi:hypothetical protein
MRISKPLLTVIAMLTGIVLISMTLYVLADGEVFPKDSDAYHGVAPADG